MPSDSWVGRHLELAVDDVAHGGHCVARHEGRVVFVRHALPGEQVVAEVTEDSGGSYCRADVVEVQTSAEGRVEAPCPLAGHCGGCDFQHADERTQRGLKARVVAEQLRRLGGVDVDVTVEPLPGGPLGWRTRTRLVAGADGRAGLRAHRSHRVVGLTEHGCAISRHGMLDGVLARRWPAGAEIEVTSDADRQVHVTVTRPPQRRRQRRAGSGIAHEHAAGRDWRITAHGFWQVHPEIADTLVSIVGEWAQVPPGGCAWDLYSGVGLFAAVLAEQVGADGHVVAVESGRRAVDDGRRNLTDVPQIEWVRGTVGAAIRSATTDPDVVVLDPPRRGAGHAVVQSIVAARPQRVIYVACDPAALARDVATFVDAGYRLTDLRAFDAFPMTHHVETVALLQW